MTNNIYYSIIIIVILLFILNPKIPCKCDKFEPNNTTEVEHFNGFDFTPNIVRNNCSTLKSEGKIINNLQTKTCKIDNKDMTDRERISIVNSCRDFTEMEIFNSRESNNWCKGIPEPNTPNSLKNNKTASLKQNNDVYPAIGKIVLNGDYYIIGQIEKPKDTVLSDLKLDAYLDGKPKLYAEKL